MSTSAPILLLLEKSEAVREELRERLDGPYRVLEAAPLRDALSVEPEQQPALVISDLRAAGEQGLTLYRQLRADPTLKAMPALLLVPSVEASETAGDAGTGAEPFLPASVGPQALRRLLDHHLTAEGAWPKPSVPPDMTLEEAVTAVVEIQMGDPDFTAGRLAGALDLSRRHLTRRTKEAMGTTPAAFIRRRRLERAEELLALSPETIRQVAEAVGFQSASAFSKAFREEKGCTPSTYVERHAE